MSLSPTARKEYYVDIGNSLPPLVLDEPEYRMRRLTTAVETFNDLRPGDANEARLAVRIVLCGAHAVDSLREAGIYRDDFAKMRRCRAQAISMMREERATRRTLAQEQRVRLAVEAVAGSAPAQPAMPSAPLQPAEPQAAPPPVQATAPASQSAPVAAPVAVSAPPAVPPHRPAATKPASQPAGEKSAPPPSPEAIAKAEAYVQENIVAAAQIRHDRGVTPQNTAYFRHLTLPTDPEVVDALVRGISAGLTVLDEIGGEDFDSAA